MMKDCLNLFRKLRKLCFIVFVIQIQVMCIYGQTKSENNELRQSLDFMFEHIDKQSVPTGLLRDYAVEEEDLDLFTGKCSLNEENVGTIVCYGNLLKTISSSALITDPIQSFKSILKQKGKLKEEGEIQLSVLLFQYARIKATALSDGLIRYENGQVFNNTKKESPYELEYVFAGCCLNSITNNSEVIFKLPSSFLLKNSNIQSLELDYGAGFYNLLHENTLKARLKKGENEIKLKAILADGEILFAHTKVVVAENVFQNQTRALPGKTRVNDYQLITGDSYDGIVTQADVYVHYAEGHASLQKPFIFVEGFDPRFISSLSETGGVWNLDRLYYTQGIKRLVEKGYDIVYVDWRKSEEYIQANANTLINVLKWVNDKKTGNEANVIMGHSMGGLVVRYALKTMENKGERHQIGTYISYDVPHLGAHIPLGVLYGFHAIRKFLQEKGIVESLLSSFTDMGDYMKLGEALAYSTAAQQMLVYYVDPAGNFNNQEHIVWQKELNALGFPKGDIGSNFNMLSVANGNYGLPSIPNEYLSTDFSLGSDLLYVFFGRAGDLALTICLNDIVACFLSVLPGRPSINGVFNIYPAKSTGQNVTHVRIKYKKKFLWVVPISKTVFSYDRSFPGGYLFDVFPSSSYSAWNKMDTTLSDYNFLRDYKGDIKVAKYIPFIPTSSALAYGDGLTSSSNYFLTKPTDTSTPFGQNYYIHTQQESHMDLTKQALDWISARLYTSIVGPGVGYEGAEYTLSNSEGSVTWSTSNPSIATINGQGVLSIRGKGIINITAQCNGQFYSRLIMVGLPRYVLSASHEPGGYKIDAECIDNEFLEDLPKLNGVIKYKWGIKFPEKDIEWVETNIPNLVVQATVDNEKVVVFFKVMDDLGNEGPVQSVEINSQDIYVASNQKLYIDSQGYLYKENKSRYSYNSARLYLNYRENIAEKYKERKWMVTSALVISPYSRTQKITVQAGGPLIRDILPESELGYIKNGSDEGEVYTYMLILLNAEGKAVQFVPVSFTFKTTV